MTNGQGPGAPWRAFTGMNLAYLQALYDKYERDPDSVEEEWRRYFDRWGAPGGTVEENGTKAVGGADAYGVSNAAGAGAAGAKVTGEAGAAVADAGRAAVGPWKAVGVDAAGAAVTGDAAIAGGAHVDDTAAAFGAERVRPEPGRFDAAHMRKIVRAAELIVNIRQYGHLAADIHPFPEQAPQASDVLDPAAYGLSREDLEAIPAAAVWSGAPADVRTAWDAVQRLKHLYTRTIAYEFAHVNDGEERRWLFAQVEAGTDPDPLSAEERLRLLRRLMEVNGFETFLHRTFAGQKRFSIEGLDSLVPMLDELVRLCAGDAYTHIMIGMAHRGRLNVLAHVLGKPYETIFSEFHHTVNKHLVPSEGSTGINHGWTGDVKYHLGATRDVPPDGNATRSIRLTLANNPSHLEFVNPVVLGFTRSVQDDRSRPGYPEQNTGRALAVLIHGDAAFSGEGIVQETLNLSRLPGYQVGGTIHIVANNGLGFTAESRDSRSTKYASDLAKGFEIPIVHVNADDPEACLRAMRLAYAYRQKYRKDFLIDLIGYRRFGHNESDDPMVTQPQLYRKIERHPRVTELYADGCLAAGIVSRDQLGEWERETEEKLRSAYNRMKQQGKRVAPASPAVLPEPDEVRTGVPLEELRDLNRLLLQFPPDFRVYPKLERILRRRAEMLADGGTIDWALAETLAFASILKEGRAVRLTGQDTERGTFAHRHLVLHDTESGATYSPLHRLASARASFAVHNSPLSEASVLGYEYGYSVCAPEVLVIWEAQFGDFVNVAQVIIDQFISSGWAKWKERSGLVLLLPHGYEGQGPEHSSARLERFLQLAAEHNWTVCNVTSAAQYFHLLRRQAAMLGTDRARPLILMSPKSLLRHPRAASPARALSDGRFARILELPQAGAGGDAGKVTRLILCSGKAAVDLESRWDETAEEDRGFLRIVRLEQLYPFPEREIADVLQRYPQLREIVWVQEEPRNMGAWTYVAPHIRKLAGTRGVRCIARPEHASPAEGYPEMHQAEQNRILTEAFWPSKEVVYHGNSHSGAR